MAQSASQNLHTYVRTHIRLHVAWGRESWVGSNSNSNRMADERECACMHVYTDAYLCVLACMRVVSACVHVCMQVRVYCRSLLALATALLSLTLSPPLSPPSLSLTRVGARTHASGANAQLGR